MQSHNYWKQICLCLLALIFVSGCSVEYAKTADRSPHMHEAQTDASKHRQKVPQLDTDTSLMNQQETKPDTSTQQAAELTLAVVGDIMLARGVGESIRQHGADYPYAHVQERLHSADYTLANLESPFGVKGKPIPGKMIWFRANKESLNGLHNSGIDGVTLANNHILDYDTENFLETMDLLAEYRIDYFGGGVNLQAARKPLLVKRKDIKIAFLGYSDFADIFWDWNYPRSFAATAERPGVAPLREDIIAADIAAARQKADIVAVAYHWGDEYIHYPSPETKAIARKSIEWGANLVLGFHPHALQGLERYNDGLIAYSLGNFVMDQKREITRESMILEVKLSQQGVKDFNVIPIKIEHNQPRILKGKAADDLLNRIQLFSDGLKEKAVN